VSESTVAEGVTDAQGQLVVPVGFASGAAKTLYVRALYVGAPGHGAAVSQAVPVPPQPALTLPSGTPPSS
jgi:hypothetical protein